MSYLVLLTAFKVYLFSRSVQGAGTSDYGAKASADLIVTRGAGFRKEKNKKKRGSYRGGDITVRFYPPTTTRLLIVWIDGEPQCQV